jgi:hypothetical protein
MITSHQCSWTRRRQSELVVSEGELGGAGVPREVLEHVGTALGVQMQARPSNTDEYGEEITLGDIASGATHDGCFFALGPSSPSLNRALMAAVLNLHATYLGAAIDWSEILAPLVEILVPNSTIRFRSRPARRKLVLRMYPNGAGLLRRATSPTIEIDCSDGRAVIV